MKRSLFTIILLTTFSLLFAQKEAPDVRKGNRAYHKENYTEAEVNYHRAIEKNDESFESYFNLGDALFLELHVADSKNLVHDQDLGVEVSRDRKGELDEHSRGIALDGRVDAGLALRKADDLVNFGVYLGFCHAENRAVEIDIFSGG